MKNKVNLGFSLVELIIIIAIIGIMSVVGLVSLSKNRNQKQVETEAQKVIATVREAQNNALTGRAIGSGYPCAFEMLFAPGGDLAKYEAKIISKNSIQGSCSLPADVTSSSYATLELVGGVEFEDGSEGRGIKFSAPFGIVAHSFGGAPLSPQAVVLRKGDYSFSFCVCASGKIVEKGNCGSC